MTGDKNRDERKQSKQLLGMTEMRDIPFREGGFRTIFSTIWEREILARIRRSGGVSVKSSDEEYNDTIYVWRF